MTRKPHDYDAELQALADKTKKLKAPKVTQLGELVHLTGADGLPFEALAGALLMVVEQSKEVGGVAELTERGQAFLQHGGKGGTKATAGNIADRIECNNCATSSIIRAV